MALEDIEGAGKYIDALQPANPASFDDRREGDNHIRGVKNTIRNTFPNITGPVTATQGQINDAVGGSFTNVTASGTVSGAVVSASSQLYSAGSLEVVGEVAGAGFSAYMNSPPPIGQVVQNIASFTALGATGLSLKSSTGSTATMEAEAGHYSILQFVAKGAQIPAPASPAWQLVIGNDAGADLFLQARDNAGTLYQPVYINRATGNVRITGDKGAAFTTQNGAASSYAVRHFGRVAAAGTKISGSDFSVTKTGTGRYTVTMNKAMPDNGFAVVGSQEDEAGNTNSLSAIPVDGSSFRVTTTNSASAPSDRSFDFIVVG